MPKLASSSARQAARPIPNSQPQNGCGGTSVGSSFRVPLSRDANSRLGNRISSSLRLPSLTFCDFRPKLTPQSIPKWTEMNSEWHTKAILQLLHFAVLRTHKNYWRRRNKGRNFSEKKSWAPNWWVSDLIKAYFGLFNPCLETNILVAFIKHYLVSLNSQIKL